MNRKITVKVGDKSYDVILQHLSPDRIEFEYCGRVYSYNTRDGRRGLKDANSNKGDSGLMSVKAQMPGVISSISISPGLELNIGSSCMILEAMKMENPIISPRSGVVQQVQVKVGDSVKSGETLFTLTVKI